MQVHCGALWSFAWVLTTDGVVPEFGQRYRIQRRIVSGHEPLQLNAGVTAGQLPTLPPPLSTVLSGDATQLSIDEW